MVPVSMALMPWRWQISRATSLVMRSSGCRPMKRSPSRIFDSGTILRYGDCSSCTASACFRVPSKTESPVVLTKSASSTLSFSVSFAEVLDLRYSPPATTAAASITTAKIRVFHDFLRAATALTPADGVAMGGTGTDAAEVAETGVSEIEGADAECAAGATAG